MKEVRRQRVLMHGQRFDPFELEVPVSSADIARLLSQRMAAAGLWTRCGRELGFECDAGRGCGRSYIWSWGCGRSCSYHLNDRGCYRSRARRTDGRSDGCRGAAKRRGNFRAALARQAQESKRP